VLHPLTIEPAVKKNIPLYVLNSMNPSGKGTAILRNELIEDGVKSVSFKENIKVINIFSMKMINTSGFLRRVFEIFSENKVSVDLISTSEANISVTVDAGEKIDRLVEQLSDYEQLRERLGHPKALGLTLDIGHIVCLEPMSVTECVRRGADTLAHVHIEDMRRGVHEHLMFGEGELDLDESLRVLTEIGYEGMVAVELSRHSHAAHETVPAARAALRAAEREAVR
jgi:aspartokinase